MQDGEVCRDIENLGCHTLEVPTIQGSRRIVKALDCSEEGEESIMG